MPEYLETLRRGNQRSDTMLVFLQGWPDNASLWDSLNWKEDLNDYDLVFINMPNTNGKATHRWGKDFPELVEDIKFSIDQFQTSKNKVLVCHDWGCVYGYMLDQKYP